MLHRLLVVAVLVAALAVAMSGTSAAAVAGGQGTGCTAKATSTLVRQFVRDYSAGRVAAINSLWAPAPRFRWFSTTAPGERLGPDAFLRSTLVPYFRSRVSVHEEIRLTELRTKYDAKRNIVNFFGKLVRRADDIAKPRAQDFKGAADCKSAAPRLIVWSM